MYGKLVITGIIVTLLSGCSAGFRPSLEDYKGSDAARVRAASEGNTALQFYEKQPSGCYKKVLERRVTAGLAFSLCSYFYLIDPAHISSISLRLKWRRLLLILRMF